MAFSRRQRSQFAGRMQELRGDRSQVEFAELLKTKQQNVSRYETGVLPGVEMLVHIAQKTKCSIDWLLFGDAPN